MRLFALVLTTMMLLIAPSFRQSIWRQIFVSASAYDTAFSSTATKRLYSSDSTNESSVGSKKIYRTVQVHVVHRHGDRSPITPLKDEDFWAKTLVPQSTLDKIASNTLIIRSDDKRNTHKANGRGPFGKLSELGLLQMIQVGNTLREQLSTDKNMDKQTDEEGNTVYPHVWHPQRPLKPSNIRVYSTDFSRTIQSVQGLLVGLFPDGTDESIPIDVRNTDWIIPDPQPRRTVEQHDLEIALASRPHILKRERELLPVASRATQALHHMLAPDAHEVSFGVPQEHPGDASIEIEPLAWNQLAEITKCLSVRNILPNDIPQADLETISRHAAWRWFENLSHPRVAYLAMNTLVGRQVDSMLNHSSEKPVTIWSAHDSTLIGLLCAYRLEQPAVWPEYASYLLIELVEITDGEQKELAVRFFLNGEHLRSQWDDEPVDIIPLKTLSEKIHTEGVMATS